MKEIYLSKYNKVLLIMEFGSMARGDYDSNSDRDIFILCRDVSYERLMVIKSRLANLLKVDKSSVNIYCFKHFKKMLSSGQLFAWHLKLEGKIIFTRIDIDKVFSCLHPYNFYKKDVTLYHNLLIDCKNSINKNGVNSFDLSMLFTVCRNICMVIAYKHNYPVFGRVSVFYKAQELISERFVLLEDEYLFLEKWKLYYGRGIEQELAYPEMWQINRIINKIEKLIDFCMGELIGE